MYSDEQRSRIYDKTSGYCHICKKKLAFTNYGRRGARGAWEVEHSVPRAAGGSHHGNNLYASCIPCNRTKGCGTTRTARRANGRTAAPLSRKARAEKRRGNAVVGAGAGALLGAMLGPAGIVVGGVVGALVGDAVKVD
jgi:5-methylcytosine-specific restriction endonuclease McrA